jgi:thermitase
MALRLLLCALLCLAAAPAGALADDELIVSRPGGLTAGELAGAGATPERDLPLPGVAVVSTDGAAEALRALRADPDVAWAEPNRRVSAAAEPFALQLWGLDRIGAPQAWPTARGAGSTVAVVDSGADLGHPDLAGRLVPGYDYVGKDFAPADESGHGTHVTGTIVAAENGLGVEGVAPEAQAMPLRVLDQDGGGYTADIATAFSYAGARGIRVVNASLSGGSSIAVRTAIHSFPNTLFIVAAGNDGKDVDDKPQYPCALDDANVLCVGATDGADQPWGRSNYGQVAVDLFAPGADILSTWPGGRYVRESGTSMAAAFTSGVAALVASRQPGWSAAQIKAALLAGTDPLPGLAGRAVTGGRLNAARTLGLAGAPPAPVAAPSPAPAAAAPAAAAAAARVSRLRLRGKPVLCRRRGCRRRAARLSFALTAAARVTVRLERRRCAHGRCRWRPAGARRRAAHAGTQAYRVGATLLGMRLAPGAWRVRVQTSANAARRTFRIRAR